MPKIGDTQSCSECGNGTLTLTMVTPPAPVDLINRLPSEEPYPAWVCSNQDCRFEQKMAEHELQA